MQRWGFFDPYTQFPIFYCLQLERKYIKNGDWVCVFIALMTIVSSYNFFWLKPHLENCLHFVREYSLLRSSLTSDRDGKKIKRHFLVGVDIEL